MGDSVFNIPSDFIQPDKQELLSLLIRYSPVALAVFDTEMRYIAASEKWITDYRLGRLDFNGMCHYDIFPEIRRHKPDWCESHQRVLKGQTESAECDRFVRADGQVDYVRWECRPWYTAAKKIGGMIMFTEVITDRVLQRRDAKRQKAYLSRAQHIAGVGYWNIDLRNNDLYWSDEVFRIHGLDPLTHFPRISSAIEAYHPDDRDQIEELITSAIRDKGTYDCRLRLVRPDGEIRAVRSIGQCEFDDNGKVIGVFGVFKDITGQEGGTNIELRVVDIPARKSAG